MYSATYGLDRDEGQLAPLTEFVMTNRAASSGGEPTLVQPILVLDGFTYAVAGCCLRYRSKNPNFECATKSNRYRRQDSCNV